MKIATSTEDFMVCSTWAKDPVEAIRLFGETSFRYLDYSFEYMDRESDSPFYKKKEDWKYGISEVAETASRLGIQFAQAHSAVSHADYAAGGELRERTILGLKNNIAACGMLGIPNIVIHGYFDYGSSDLEANFQANKLFFEEFTDELEKYNVYGLIENGGDAKFLLGAIEHAKNPRMKAVWDIGHANTSGMPQYDNIVALGKQLHGIHLHDNFGSDYKDRLEFMHMDTHMAPFTGTVNYDEVMQGLLDSGYQGYFTLEAINAMRWHKAYPWNPRKTWKGESRLQDPPTKLRVLAEELLYETAKSMLMAYDCFEE